MAIKGGQEWGIMSIPACINTTLLDDPEQCPSFVKQFSCRSENRGWKMIGEEDPLLQLPGLRWAAPHSVGQAPHHKQFLLLLLIAPDLCLYRQEMLPQPLLRQRIYAQTHKHTAREHNIKWQRTAVALSFTAILLQGQLCHIGRTRGHTGQQSIKGSKLFSDYFVYCASGFWLGGVVILSSLPWAVKAIKAFVLDWCLGKSGWVLGLFLYQVCQIGCYVWHAFIFLFSLSPLPDYFTSHVQKEYQTCQSKSKQKEGKQVPATLNIQQAETE